MKNTFYPKLTNKQINTIQKLIVNWWEDEIYKKGKRNFFWREWIFNPEKEFVKLNDNEFKRDFGIFCTETVLRRTKAESVNIYFKPFFKKYNSFQDLKNSNDNELRGIISPLGRMSQNVQDLKGRATLIVDNFDSRVPDMKESIRSLMKTSKRKKRHIYLVEAIALYVHGIFSAPVDSNVERIYTRLFGIIRKNYGVQDDHEFCNFAKTLAPKNNLIKYNLALLDLSALVCIPKSPKCSLCLLEPVCDYKK